MIITANMNAGFPNEKMKRQMVPCVLKERQEAQAKGVIPAELQARYDIVYPANEGGFCIIEGEKYEVEDGLSNAEWAKDKSSGDFKVSRTKGVQTVRKNVPGSEV